MGFNGFSLLYIYIGIAPTALNGTLFVQYQLRRSDPLVVNRIGKKHKPRRGDPKTSQMIEIDAEQVTLRGFIVLYDIICY